MMLTNLADVVRGAGLAVSEQSGWTTRTAGTLKEVRAIVCHHTAGAATGDMPSLGTLINGRSDVPGPLAQLGLGRSGTVYIVAAGRANHAGSGQGYNMPTNDANEYSIGIEAESVGNGKDWTPEQLDAYPRLAAALAQAYGVPTSQVIAHREWAPGRKVDPTGIDMPTFRSQVDAIRNGSTPAPTPAPAPTPSPSPNGTNPQDGQDTLLVDGDMGGRTIARWQQVLGTPTTGQKDAALISADQAFLNTVVSLQDIRNLTYASAPSLATDGDDGVYTKKVRQYYLYNTTPRDELARYTDDHETQAKGEDWDGDFGSESTMLLQNALNKAVAGSGRY